MARCSVASAAARWSCDRAPRRTDRLWAPAAASRARTSSARPEAGSSTRPAARRRGGRRARRGAPPRAARRMSSARPEAGSVDRAAGSARRRRPGAASAARRLVGEDRLRGARSGSARGSGRRARRRSRPAVALFRASAIRPMLVYPLAPAGTPSKSRSAATAADDRAVHPRRAAGHALERAPASRAGSATRGMPPAAACSARDRVVREDRPLRAPPPPAGAPGSRGCPRPRAARGRTTPRSAG